MIAIVCDSTVGYSTVEIGRREILSVVPVNYQIANSLREELASDQNGDFLPEMEKNFPCKTAHPYVESFTRVFRTLTEQGYDVICVTMSAALSGTFSCAQFAAGQVDGRIRVVDSETIGPGLHLLVDEAVNMAKAGFPVETVVEQLDILKKKIGIVFTVDSLPWLQAGGRMSNPRAQAQLNVRPLFELKGKILFKGNIRGHNERLGRLLKALPDNVRRIIVGRCGEQTDISELVALLHERYPSVYIHTRVLGPVQSVHLGPGAFGIAYITKD